MSYIDALRGFACLWVVVFHAFSGRNHGLPGGSHFYVKAIKTFFTLGYLGVHLFLVLSGFCLFYPLVRKLPLHQISVDVKDFARRRAWRILPAYYAALAIFVVLRLTSFGHQSLGGFGGVKDVVLHLLLLHNLTRATSSSINPVFWSLALECQLYLLFPLLVFLARRQGIGAIVAATLFASIVWQLVVFHFYGNNPDSLTVITLYRALPGRCFEFAAGMAAAFFVARPVPNQVRWSLALTLAFIVIGVWHQTRVSTYGPFADQIWGVVFASLIVALRPVPEIHFQRIGPLRALAAIGVFSYSIYLIHLPLLHMISTEALKAHHITLSSKELLLFGGARILLMVALGYLFFLVAERPFLHHASSRKPRGGAPVSVADSKEPDRGHGNDPLRAPAPLLQEP